MRNHWTKQNLWLQKSWNERQRKIRKLKRDIKLGIFKSVRTIRWDLSNDLKASKLRYGNWDRSSWNGNWRLKA